MNRLKAFGVFWYDFIIGDDWKIAFGVVVGLALSALLVHSVSSAVWWVLPVAVVITLAISLRFAVSHK
jgi:hypothetical protein